MADILTKGTRAPGFTLHVTPDQTRHSTSSPAGV